MKKVLALVLAVIMVSTMAMAVTITGNSTAFSGSSDFADQVKYPNITPGAQIEFAVTELFPAGFDAVAPNGKFDPNKNSVAVNYVSGKGLIASEGWVKTGAGESVNDYTYIIKTVDKEVLLDNAADIVIDKITCARYGYNESKTFYYVNAAGDYAWYGVDATTVFYTIPSTSGNYGYAPETEKFSGDAHFVTKFDFGYVPAKFALNADAKGILTTNPTAAAGTTYIADSGLKGGKTNTKAIFAQTVNGTGDYSAVVMHVNTNLVVGDQFHVGTITTLKSSSAAAKKLAQNIADNDAEIVVENNTNLSINKATVISFDKAKESYKLYSVNADGTVSLVPTTWDATKGLLSAKVDTYGHLILVDGTLTATTVIEPGTTTTNPGTGANDVVGVAAALAVVALVSGAAISLKK